MKFSESIENDKNLFIDECITTTCLPKNNHQSIQCQNLHQEQLPSTDYIYTEVSKPIQNNGFIEDKRLLKRASWTSSEQLTYGLPPTGKRTSADHSTVNKNSNRISMAREHSGTSKCD